MCHVTLPLGGTCRCTATEFQITAPPLMTFACHCIDCQKMSASAFSLVAIIPADGFAIVKGAPVARPLPGSPRNHAFCPDCMTALYTKIDGIDGRLNVRATLCTDRSWVRPFLEIRTAHKLPWAETGAIHSFADVPTADEFARLLSAYAEWAGD